MGKSSRSKATLLSTLIPGQSFPLGARTKFLLYVVQLFQVARRGDTAPKISTTGLTRKTYHRDAGLVNTVGLESQLGWPKGAPVNAIALCGCCGNMNSPTPTGEVSSALSD